MRTQRWEADLWLLGLSVIWLKWYVLDEDNSCIVIPSMRIGDGGIFVANFAWAKFYQSTHTGSWTSWATSSYSQLVFDLYNSESSVTNPVIQRMTGSRKGSLRLSKAQKNKCLSPSSEKTIRVHPDMYVSKWSSTYLYLHIQKFLHCLRTNFCLLGEFVVGGQALHHVERYAAHCWT